MRNNIHGFIPRDQFNEQAPLQTHLKLEIRELPRNSESVQIDLTIPLSAEAPAEKRAGEEIDLVGGSLDLVYEVKINFAHETAVMKRAINSLYGTGVMKRALDKDALKIETTPEDYSAYVNSIRELAALGNSMFNRMFVDKRLIGRYTNITHGAQQLAHDALCSALRRAHLIDILSPQPLYPWAWLFDAETRSSSTGMPDLSQFWGMRHQLREAVEGVSGNVLMAAPEKAQIIGAICPTTNQDQDLSGTLNRYFGEQHGIREDQISVISNVDELHDRLVDCEADIIYFLGHASHDEIPSPATSWLMLQNVKLTAADIAKRSPAVSYRKNPVLMFLNACNSAALNHWNADSIAGILCLDQMARNHVCCLLTAAPVPRRFAREFGKLVWSRVLNGTSIGEAVLATRTQLLHQYNNPLGLVYTLFGRLETRLG